MSIENSGVVYKAILFSVISLLSLTSAGLESSYSAEKLGRSQSKMRPFPQPIWLVPYYAMSLRYGDSPRRGNAILINDGGVENALRVASQGYRIIIDPNDYDTRYRASIVAYYI